MHEVIKDLYISIIPSGSRVICNPPPMDTDIDYVVLTDARRIDKLVAALVRDGFVMGGSEPEDIKDQDMIGADYSFQSFKKGEVNYILTTSSELYGNFDYATDIAQKLNLLDKKQRIDLFQIILYDNWEERT